MGETHQSLLPIQLEEEPALALATREERAGVYSGKILDAQEERLERIVNDLAAGRSQRAIVKLHRVHPYTLRAIAQRHGTKIEALKNKLAANLYTFVTLGVDRLVEEVDTMDVDRLAVSIGIAADKALLLSGDATSIVAHEERGPRYTLEALRAKLAPAEKRVGPDGTGFAADIPRQIGAPAGAPGVALPGPSVDSKSTPLLS